jgi:hypothetical protein
MLFAIRGGGIFVMHSRTAPYPINVKAVNPPSLFSKASLFYKSFTNP